jgi:hypothetical protein
MLAATVSVHYGCEWVKGSAVPSHNSCMNYTTKTNIYMTTGQAQTSAAENFAIIKEMFSFLPDN